MTKDFQKEAQKKEIKKTLPSEETEEGKECPRCSTINVLEARFCAECGYDFSGFKVCPYCGKKIEENAGICKFCGEWLLEGKCKFCYADIEEGATYCAECGSLLKEITCPECGKLCHFEFCEYCGNPLTPRAEKVFENIKSNNKEFESRNFFDNIDFLEVSDSISKNEELVKMKAYLNKAEKGKKKKVYMPLFSKKQKESIESIDKIANKEIERQEKERKRKEEEERKKKLAEECKRNGTIFLSKEKIKITVHDENCALDDAFWLYVNGKKIGFINHPQGGSTSYDVNLIKGINKVELKFDHANGCGTYAIISINGFKMDFGGSVDHIWMAVLQ